VLTDNECHHNNTLYFNHYNDMDLKLRNPSNMFITVYKHILLYRFNYVLILFINHVYAFVTVVGPYYICRYLHDQSVEAHTSRMHGMSETFGHSCKGRIRGGVFGIRQKPLKSSLTSKTYKLATIFYPRA